ncbi:hypothetical protein [Haloterrigena gelatinilytica]|nr:hypothetical protein [Haloterrigena gelatinilytica]
MSDAVEEAIDLLESAKELADAYYCEAAHEKSQQALELLKVADR